MQTDRYNGEIVHACNALTPACTVLAICAISGT